MLFRIPYAPMQNTVFLLNKFNFAGTMSYSVIDSSCPVWFPISVFISSGKTRPARRYNAEFSVWVRLGLPVVRFSGILNSEIASAPNTKPLAFAIEISFTRTQQTIKYHNGSIFCLITTASVRKANCRNNLKVFRLNSSICYYVK